MSIRSAEPPQGRRPGWVITAAASEHAEGVRGFIWSSHDVRERMQEALETLRLAQDDKAPKASA